MYGDEAGLMFPTCVGVNRSISMRHTAGRNVPHVRGGEPAAVEAVESGQKCSPRAWG